MKWCQVPNTTSPMSLSTTLKRFSKHARSDQACHIEKGYQWLDHKQHPPWSNSAAFDGTSNVMGIWDLRVWEEKEIAVQRNEKFTRCYQIITSLSNTRYQIYYINYAWKWALSNKRRPLHSFRTIYRSECGNWANVMLLGLTVIRSGIPSSNDITTQLRWTSDLHNLHTESILQLYDAMFRGLSMVGTGLE